MTGVAFTPAWVVVMLALTLRAPAEAARRLVMLHLPRPVLIQMLVLVTALSTLIVALASGSLREPEGAGAGTIAALSPLVHAGLLGGSLLLMGLALHVVGRALGGGGSLDDALTLVIWLEVLAAALRIIQMMAGLVAPELGVMVSIAGLILLLWTMLNFINVLHGFGSIGRSLLALLLAVTGISLGLAVILSLIGISPAGGTFDV